MSALGALSDLLPRTTLFVGKGGVGKTTCATHVARAFAERGDHTLVLSTDPAAALGDALGSAVGPSITTIGANLDAWQLDATALRAEFLAAWRGVIADILDRGTYLDRDDVDGLLDAALPGADEIFALLGLADIITSSGGDYDRIVVDTAPTGHTLRLLALPETFSALIGMLDLMQSKHRFIVRALTRRYRRDAADEFIDSMRERIVRLKGTLADAGALAAVLVVRAEPVVEAESRRYLEQLHALHINVAAIVVNAADAHADAQSIDASLPHVVVPRWESPVRRSPERPAIVHQMPATRTLTIVGGKGGVGKSTAACALAIAAAEGENDDVLLVSTDPAPSLADALGETDEPWARMDQEHRVSNIPRLVVQQMDATAAFARLRDEYQSRVDALFSALVGRGVDVEHDRAILRDLLSLAPPGIDEVFALSLLGETLAEGRFGRIIVDPAPTGHLLRLLDMPAIALAWSRRLMRLMLKYSEVIRVGDTAEDLLSFSRRTRAIEELLRDRTRSGVVLVALDEPVVRAETSRLAAEIDSRGIEVAALLWNRVSQAPAPLPTAHAAPQFFAEETSPSPVGIDAIRAWSRSWRVLPP